MTLELTQRRIKGIWIIVHIRHFVYKVIQKAKFNERYKYSCWVINITIIIIVVIIIIIVEFYRHYTPWNFSNLTLLTVCFTHTRLYHYTYKSSIFHFTLRFLITHVQYTRKDRNDDFFFLSFLSYRSVRLISLNTLYMYVHIWIFFI